MTFYCLELSLRFHHSVSAGCLLTFRNFTIALPLDCCPRSMHHNLMLQHSMKPPQATLLEVARRLAAAAQEL